ncbi:HAD family hydrolase [Saccharopolyspora sp. NPDC050642]|uniref:HAD family hydrolase n=1 Tax=Saccharopolyspora sp. NPDC050642 TaxID=3157099 RepID=UPI0033CC70FD
MTGPPEIISSSDAVLLDFDGPVCAVFGGLADHQVAAGLRELFEGELPDAVDRSRDPFDVLKYAAATTGGFATVVEHRLRELESRAVEVAPPTPGAVAVLESLSRQAIPVVIVSNNSETAVHAYLQAHGLTNVVADVSARTNADVSELKPQPHLLLRAASFLGVSPERCVMIGDSVTDIEAAQRAGAKCIAYANKPGKREQFEELQPGAIVDQMAELI